MFGLFKSSATKRHERWLQFNAQMLQQVLRDVWAVESAMDESADYERFKDRMLSEQFAGYLVGFADVLVCEMVEDEPTRRKYSRLFFDLVLTDGACEWVQEHIVRYTETRSEDFAAAVRAGQEDSSDCRRLNRPAVTRLGKLFIYDKGLAA